MFSTLKYQVIAKWIACMILHLLGLLYHTTEDIKNLFAGAILSTAHTLD